MNSHPGLVSARHHEERLHLDLAARGHAFLAGKDFVSPDDVRAVAHDVLRHRLILSFEAEAQVSQPIRR